MDLTERGERTGKSEGGGEDHEGSRGRFYLGNVNLGIEEYPPV